MDVGTLENGLLALGAGLLISPHCLAMCGPLSCAVLAGGNVSRVSDWDRTLYHLGRILSYGSIGALAGGLGLGLVSLFGLEPVRYFPWFLVGVLLIFAFRLDRRLPPLPVLRKPLEALRPTLRKLPTTLSGLGLGISTPLLPCAPLYSVFWVALLSGSPVFGAEIAIGFALGTIPLLWSGQVLFSRFRQKLKPGILLTVQRSVALLAAGILVWRIVAAGGAPLVSEFCGLQ